MATKKPAKTGSAKGSKAASSSRAKTKVRDLDVKATMVKGGRPPAAPPA